MLRVPDPYSCSPPAAARGGGCGGVGLYLVAGFICHRMCDKSSVFVFCFSGREASEQKKKRAEKMEECRLVRGGKTVIPSLFFFQHVLVLFFSFFVRESRNSCEMRSRFCVSLFPYTFVPLNSIPSALFDRVLFHPLTLVVPCNNTRNNTTNSTTPPPAPTTPSRYPYATPLPNPHQNHTDTTSTPTTLTPTSHIRA